MYHTIINPLPFLCYYGVCCRKFHQILIDKYNLSQIENDQYVFCNRDKGNWRHITNMEEICNETKKLYSYIEWKYMKDFFPTIKETTLNWVKIKMIFLPTGSNCVKCLAMKPGSVMVVALGRGVDTAAIRTAISCDLFNIWFFVWSMDHFGDKNKSNYVNISLALKAISIGLYATKYYNLPQREF